ncbi:MAG: GHKL domain-containing protein [Clostridia bacterium]|nr:GHKL domain-containing protein [Clostridia bacterium]
MTREIFEVCATLFDSILAIWFVTKFCKLQNKRMYQIAAVILLFCVTVFGDHYLASFSTLSAVLLTVVTILYTVAANYGITFRQILASCLFWLSLIAVSSILFITISMITQDFESHLMGNDTIVRYIYVILHKVVLFTLLRVILAFVNVDGKLGRLNTILTFTISMISILGLGATMVIATSDMASTLGAQIAILIVSFLLVNVILYFMLAQIQRLQRREYELKLLEEKTAFDSARHEETTSVWQNVRRIQHDMKHHLSVINAQLESGSVDESLDYLHKLLPEIESMGRVIRSENKTIDYIINSKLSPLQNTQIVITGLIGDFSDIEDRDLACLFGNILDNAIEAISNLEEKRIEIHFSLENSSRMIIFKNTIGRPVLKYNPELKSTKTDSSSHGYGHKIVERIVKEHKGMIDYFEEGDMFGVQIILPGTGKKR